MTGRDVQGSIESTVFEEGESDLIELLTAPTNRPDGDIVSGIIVGTFVGFGADGAKFLVTYPGQPGTMALSARAMTKLNGSHIGRPAVLFIDQRTPPHPIILGCLVNDTPPELASTSSCVEVDADGESLVVSASERIVLRCGKASITLTKDGKLILQGQYVSSQSAGVLRLKGGSVQIN